MTLLVLLLAVLLVLKLTGWRFPHRTPRPPASAPQPTAPPSAVPQVNRNVEGTLAALVLHSMDTPGARLQYLAEREAAGGPPASRVEKIFAADRLVGKDVLQIIAIRRAAKENAR